jgi:hypothetical protein
MHHSTFSLFELRSLYKHRQYRLFTLGDHFFIFTTRILCAPSRLPISSSSNIRSGVRITKYYAGSDHHRPFR